MQGVGEGRAVQRLGRTVGGEASLFCRWGSWGGREAGLLGRKGRLDRGGLLRGHEGMVWGGLFKDDILLMCGTLVSFLMPTVAPSHVNL